MKECVCGDITILLITRNVFAQWKKKKESNFYISLSFCEIFITAG